MEFAKLKNSRGHTFELIRDAFDRELYDLREKSSQRRLFKRLEEALKVVDRNDVIQTILTCASGNRCGSLWCPTCRTNAGLAAANKVVRRVQLKSYDNNDLLHITAPVGLAKLNVEDVNRIVKEDALRWKRIRKKHHFWIEATYEFELVNYQFLMRSKGSEQKKIQMSQMIQSSNFKGNEFLFVHWHGVTDLGRENIDKVFSHEYFLDAGKLQKTSSSGLYVQGFRTNQDISENIKKVSSYPFKSVYRFKHSFKGNDSSNGEYLTLQELGNLVSLYQDMQGRQWRRLRRHNGLS